MTTTHGLGEVVGYDEHVWTATRNAAAITRAIGEALGEIDPANCRRLRRQRGGLRIADRRAGPAVSPDFFAGAGNRTMVFGDRFPLRYFAEEFDIDY